MGLRSSVDSFPIPERFPMVEVVISYETLFDVLRKEKSRDELQQLPADFYGQVVAYLRLKRTDVDAAGGFSSPQAQKALIQYRNVQKILRELYERRERKILEMALNRARTSSALIDTGAILAEERRLFDESSMTLRLFRASLLEPVLEGEAPPGVVVPSIVVREEPEAKPTSSESSVSPEQVASRERCPVKFIASVPKFLGLAGEVHGPYEPGEQAELPGKIAAVLLRKKRVELA
jgi:DNA replication initiation complex subunit (GINS family)